MKKFTGKIFAGIFTAAVLATAAFATDYTSNPDYSGPSTPAVSVSDDQVKDGATVEVDGQAASVSGDALTALGDGEVTFTLKDGSSVTVSAVTKAQDINIGVSVSTSDKASELSSGVKVPANATVVAPVHEGEFGLTMKVTVATTLDGSKAKLYYVSDDGKAEDVTKSTGFKIEDGKATFSITHGSAYVISEEEIKSAGESGKPGTDTPDTGVTLPIALVVLAGGSVAVSAIAAKKRK